MGLLMCPRVIFMQLYSLAMIVMTMAVPHPPTSTTTQASIVREVPSYDNKFDNVDLDEILKQDRLLNNYIKCLEGTGPCTPDGKQLKEILPDAISTECIKCTEKQKYGADKVVRHLIDKRPDDWSRLERIYDPQGSYRLKYLDMKLKINPPIIITKDNVMLESQPLPPP